MKERINVRLTKERYDKLVRRMNYFSTSRTQIIYLHFFLFQEAHLEEQEVKEALLEIDLDNEREKFNFVINDYFLNIFKNKQKYLFSLHDYISAFLNTLLKYDDTFEGMEIESKQEKIKSTSRMDKELKAWVDGFSNKTGLSKNVFINYALCQKLEDMPEGKLDFTGKPRYGFYLPKTTFDYINEINYDERNHVIHNHIKAFKTIAE